MTRPAALQVQPPGATSQSDTVAPHELGAGTGRVQSIAVGPDETWLNLGYPDGRQITVTVPGVPQYSTENDFRLDAIRPLAVRMSSRGPAVDCSVLGTSESGPRRIGLSLAQALGLCASGIHTVFCSE
jgi:hypothetical protein